MKLTFRKTMPKKMFFWIVLLLIAVTGIFLWQENINDSANKLTEVLKSYFIPETEIALEPANLPGFNENLLEKFVSEAPVLTETDPTKLTFEASQLPEIPTPLINPETVSAEKELTVAPLSTPTLEEISLQLNEITKQTAILLARAETMVNQLAKAESMGPTEEPQTTVIALVVEKPASPAEQDQLGAIASQLEQITASLNSLINETEQFIEEQTQPASSQNEEPESVEINLEISGVEFEPTQ